MPVIDNKTGETLEHHQLQRHPKHKNIWTESYSNEIDRLFQGIGKVKGTHGPTKQRVPGTDAFRVIQYEDIPKYRNKEIIYTKNVCKYRPQKEDPYHTRITIGGNRICYPGEVGTPTVSLEIVKLVINSVLSRRNARFACFVVKKIYLKTPMERPEYARTKVDDIPPEFMEE